MIAAAFAATLTNHGGSVSGLDRHSASNASTPSVWSAEHSKVARRTSASVRMSRTSVAESELFSTADSNASNAARARVGRVSNIFAHPTQSCNLGLSATM